MRYTCFNCSLRYELEMVVPPVGMGWGQVILTLLWVINMAVSKMAAKSYIHWYKKPATLRTCSNLLPVKRGLWIFGIGLSVDLNFFFE